MPKAKLQEVIFTILMVIVMVYAVVCYNIALPIVISITQGFTSILKAKS